MRLHWALSSHRGISRHLCGRLKETERLKHKRNFSTPLKSHVQLQSEARQEAVVCLSLQQYYKLSGMERNSLLCLVIEGVLHQTPFHLCFRGRWQNYLLRDFWFVWSDVMQTIRGLCMFIYWGISAWVQLHASTSHSMEWGAFLTICLTEQACITMY